MGEVERRARPVEKIATGIPGFDIVAEGGLPEERSTLIAGTAGSGKTLFSTQFLVEGIRGTGESGVFVTFEDTPESIRSNVLSLSWDIEQWEADGKWAFVDASPITSEDATVAGTFDLGALLARIRHAASKVGARRIVLDSLSALLTRMNDDIAMRAELQHVMTELKRDGMTIVFTGERPENYGPTTRHGIEEYIADNVIILRHVLVEERRRRTVEILKYRGTSHQNGEFPATIHDKGFLVVPLSAHELTQKSSTKRIQSGDETLDAMCGGGFFRDSIILVSGATGTGKTLMVTQFLDGGIQNGERCLLFAFEESREQLNRNALGWGYDFEKLEAEGALRIVTVYPHAYTLEDHLVRLKREIDEFEPDRVAIDSLSALERISTSRGFREFVTNLTAHIKRREVAGLFTSTAPTLAGGTSVTEKHISTITDTIILLRYIESGGKVLRGVTVLKMRGSWHEKEIREFTIDGEGMHIGEPFQHVTNLLIGPMRHLSEGEESLL